MPAISPRLCTRLPPYAASHVASMNIVSAEKHAETADRLAIQPFVDRVSVIMRVWCSRVNEQITSGDIGGFSDPAGD
jgi:hypothetical protein